MTKRPFGTPNVRLMGDFKAIALDYEFWLSNDATGALYCLNDRDIYVLLSLCEYASWWTRWYNTDDINRSVIAALAAELQVKLMSCVDITVLVEQAKLNQAQSSQAQVVAAAAARQVLEDRYDGTPPSINPSAPDTFFGVSPARYDALCAALTAFVYQFAASQANVLRVGQVGGLAAAALVAALLIPGLNFFFIVGASIAVLLGMGTIGLTTEAAINALTDKDALNAVICLMRDRLYDQSVNESNWNACLDTYPFPVGSNAAIVADFVKATLADNYLTILNMLGQAYDGTVNGDEMPECPCSDTWTYEFPVSGSWPGWDLLTFSGATTTQSGGKLIGANNSTNNAVFLNAQITVDGNVSGVSITVEWSGPSPAAQALLLYIDDVQVGSIDLNALTSPAALVYTVPQTGSHVYKILSGVTGSTADGKYLRAIASNWSGTGANPFV